MRAAQLLALVGLCLPWVSLAGGCKRVVHEVGAYSATQTNASAAGTAASAGSGAGTGSSGSAASDFDAGRSGVGASLPPDAATSVVSADGTCVFTVQPAKRKPLDMYIMMDAYISLQWVWVAAKQGLEAFAADPRSVGQFVGLRFYGTDCSADAYDLQPTVDNDVLPQVAPALDNFIKQAPTLPASQTYFALQGGIAHQTKRATKQADAKHIVVLITDGFSQDLFTCANLPAYSSMDVAAIAARGQAQAIPIETHLIELNVLPPGIAQAVQLATFQGLDQIAASGSAYPALLTDPTNVAGSVNENLQSVRRRAQPLDFEPALNVDKDKVGVAIVPSSGSGEIPRVGIASNCNGHDGWFYDDAQNPKHIFLCPTTRDKLTKDDSHSVALLLGCAPKT